jgi:hypothetical protein
MMSRHILDDIVARPIRPHTYIQPSHIFFFLDPVLVLVLGLETMETSRLAESVISLSNIVPVSLFAVSTSHTAVLAISYLPLLSC